jgi:transcriptional regulator with XRE-family HTH domain
MNLSVQSINKWRHGHNLPDIENVFILSRSLGKRVDDFLVPLATEQPMFEVEIEAGQDPASILRRLKEYAIRLGALFLNHSLNDSTA